MPLKKRALNLMLTSFCERALKVASRTALVFIGLEKLQLRRPSKPCANGIMLLVYFYRKKTQLCHLDLILWMYCIFSCCYGLVANKSSNECGLKSFERVSTFKNAPSWIKYYAASQLSRSPTRRAQRRDAFSIFFNVLRLSQWVFIAF